MKSWGKSWKVLAVAVFAAALAFALAGCQGGSDSAGESAAPEQSQPADMTDQVQDIAEPAEPEFQVSTDPFYVLVMGVDSREGTVEKDPGGQPRSDTMMLVKVDPSTYQIGILSIPRDTYAWVGDKDNKINEGFHLGGPEGAVEQVELLTGVHADYYLYTTFVGFEDLVNSLGGVDAYVPIDMSLRDIVGGDDISLAAGEQHLDGAQALVLARVRKTYSWDGDTHRQTNSRAMVENLIQKVASDPDSATAAADALYEDCETDMDRQSFDAWVQLFCDHADKISFVDGTTPYANGMDDSIGLWIVYRDEDTSRACANAVDAHENPQDIVPLPDTY